MKRLSWRVSDHEIPKRLDQYLFQQIPQHLSYALSRSKIRQLIIVGAVYLNQRRVRVASRTVQPLTQVTLYLNEAILKQTPSFQMTSEHILWEDENLIAVQKPPFLPTQPTLDNARENLWQALKKYLAQRENQLVSEIYLGLHHRLDRDTSGVVLFTKHPRANPGMAHLFSMHQIQKIYWAWSADNSQSAEHWTVSNYLKSVPLKRSLNQYHSVASGGKKAVTTFYRKSVIRGMVLFEAHPKTGRTHQIRVHLSESGFPILGDTLYGGLTYFDSRPVPRLMLHAKSLRFQHPLTGADLMIQSPLTQDLLMFQKQVGST